VTGTYYVPTFTTNAEVTVNGSGFESGITASSANPDYTVLAVASTPTTVTLLVTTDSNATSGTSSTITLTNPDGGSGTFPLNGGPNPNTVTPAPKATHVNGVVHTGKTTTVTISGTHFYGQPKITSNAKGTTVHVVKDSGKLLTLKVATKSTTPEGYSHIHHPLREWRADECEVQRREVIVSEVKSRETPSERRGSLYSRGRCIE